MFHQLRDFTKLVKFCLKVVGWIPLFLLTLTSISLFEVEYLYQPYCSEIPLSFLFQCNTSISPIVVEYLYHSFFQWNISISPFLVEYLYQFVLVKYSTCYSCSGIPLPEFFLAVYLSQWASVNSSLEGTDQGSPLTIKEGSKIHFDKQTRQTLK